MKRTTALFGLVGLVGCFLPLIAGISLWDLRGFDFGGGIHVYLIMAAFAVPVLTGLGDKASAGTGLLALGCFGFNLYEFGFRIFDMLRYLSIGGILMAVAAVGGFIAGLASLVGKHKD